jgi:hypothetical protein
VIVAFPMAPLDATAGVPAASPLDGFSPLLHASANTSRPDPATAATLLTGAAR